MAFFSDASILDTTSSIVAMVVVFEEITLVLLVGLAATAVAVLAGLALAFVGIQTSLSRNKHGLGMQKAVCMSCRSENDMEN